jgi:hypothetical protein
LSAVNPWHGSDSKIDISKLLLQIYKAERPEWAVRVYNLLYEDSQEADKFAAAVAREVPFHSLLTSFSWHRC